jgi:hypothetical protein
MISMAEYQTRFPPESILVIPDLVTADRGAQVLMQIGGGGYWHTQ